MIAFHYWIYAATWPWYAIFQRGTASFNLLQLSSFITLYTWNTKICETLVTFSFLFETILSYCPFTSLIKTRWGGGVIIFLVKRESRMSKKYCVMWGGGGNMKKICPFKKFILPPPPPPPVYIMNAGKTTKILGHFMIIISLKPH